MQLNVSHAFLPKRNSTRASIVIDHFGIDFEQGRHVIAEGLELPIQPGDVVLFTGPSGSGKSSLLRAAADELRKTADAEGDPVFDVDRLDLGIQILIDAVPGPVDEALHLLSACGLGEARVLLRTPAELSEGQRYRFRLALAVAQPGEWVLADEFTATLDRTLARVIAYNVQRLARRTGKGFLLATTHEDIVEDLAPDVHVKCRLDGEVEVAADEYARTGCRTTRFPVDGAGRDWYAASYRAIAMRAMQHPRLRESKKTISFGPELWISAATGADWPYFARWHYRSHRIGPVRFVTLLWHGREPVGICVFTSPPMSLAARNRYFGCSGKWTRTALKTLNQQLVMLSRVVLHPTYRGAGIAALFVRRSCELCPFRWIETLAEMGHVNPFFEKAGFVRVGASTSAPQSRSAYSQIYGGKRQHGSAGLISEETYRKSRHTRPVYYVFDNRRAADARDTKRPE
jgi:ABC-type lipoprotein export system ATPase subunit/GNAT superfamily N-acetyltransferase